jgi:hypothetical protein
MLIFMPMAASNWPTPIVEFASDALPLIIRHALKTRNHFHWLFPARQVGYENSGCRLISGQ